MKKQFKLGVIGGGFMAHAIVKEGIESGFLSESAVLVSDCLDENLEKFRTAGCATTTNNRSVAEGCEFVLFAIKPQHFPTVAAELKDIPIGKAISIMAGIGRENIRRMLPMTECICRVMPNLPCSIGYGAIAADPSEFSSEEDLRFLDGLFSSLGAYITVSEDKMNAVTGISGSGPAYVFLFVKALIEVGKKQGLSEEEARRLAVQTVLGGAKMLSLDETDIDVLIQRVCSKGGTTEKAMESFRKDDLIGTVENAVDACVARSKELAK